MGIPVILTPQAIEDLSSIVRQIATDSPERAGIFGHALLDAALAIDPFPGRGRTRSPAGGLSDYLRSPTPS